MKGDVNIDVEKVKLETCLITMKKGKKSDVGRKVKEDMIWDVEKIKKEK